MSGNRKLAAILAADVVGYSRLMGIDEEGTLAQLRGHRHPGPAWGKPSGRSLRQTQRKFAVKISCAVLGSTALACATCVG